jgi:hypothetical protein
MWLAGNCVHCVILMRWISSGVSPSFLFQSYSDPKTHHDWTQVFLAAPTVLGVIDTYGIELIHPIREGRSPQQIGRKGLSNHRWIVGGKLCLLLNQWGLVQGKRIWKLSSFSVKVVG